MMSNDKPYQPRILWVEDDGNQRKVIRELFELYGYEGTVASNGAEALEILQARVIDVLLTDIGMPEMNGWQLIESARQNIGNDLRIVIVSGWALEIDQETCSRLQIECVISKPYRIRQLREVLERPQTKPIFPAVSPHRGVGREFSAPTDLHGR